MRDAFSPRLPYETLAHGREVFMHSGESQELAPNDPNTLQARLRRIARENQ